MTVSLNKTILVIIGSYLPGTNSGGPVRTTSNMVKWLGAEYNFHILTANQDFNSDKPYEGIEPGKWYDVDQAKVRYLFPNERSLGQMARIISETPHDMVYVDSVLATLSVKYMILRRLGRVPQRPVIVVTRGNLGVGTRQLKFFKKQIYFFAARAANLYRNVTWHVSSEQEARDVMQVMGTKRGAIHVIPNLPDPELLQDGKWNRPPKEPNAIRQLTLSRISRIKNIHFILEALREVQADVVYDLYGPIEDEVYWRECQAIIAQLPPNIKVTYKGTVPFTQVLPVLQQYHLFVLPTLHENFGHVILEALCAGCAVLISDQTPWQDMEDKGVGWDLPLVNEQFVLALNEFSALPTKDFEEISRNAIEFGHSFVRDKSYVAAMEKLFDHCISVPHSA